MRGDPKDSAIFLANVEKKSPETGRTPPPLRNGRKDGLRRCSSSPPHTRARDVRDGCGPLTVQRGRSGSHRRGGRSAASRQGAAPDCNALVGTQGCATRGDPQGPLALLPPPPQRRPPEPSRLALAKRSPCAGQALASPARRAAPPAHYTHQVPRTAARGPARLRADHVLGVRALWARAVVPVCGCLRVGGFAGGVGPAEGRGVGLERIDQY